jgi:hypothetical protein
LCQNFLQEIWRQVSIRTKTNATGASQQKKEELRPAVTVLFRSVPPELAKQGADILRRLGIGEDIVSKLTDPESFANAVLDDPQLTSDHINQITGLLQEAEKSPARLFKPVLRQLLKALPRIVAGGRTPVVSTDEKQEIVEFVHKLLLSVSQGIAVQRAASRYGISRRTVQRIWKDRDKIPPKR